MIDRFDDAVDLVQGSRRSRAQKIEERKQWWLDRERKWAEQDLKK